jgi:hypothetical protein
MSRWLGLLLALALGALLYLGGAWRMPATPLALLVLAVLGAIFPPAALVVGGVAIVVVLLIHGQAAMASWSRLMKGGAGG